MKNFLAYYKLIIINYILIIVLRLIETGLIIKNYGLHESLFISEIIGVSYDILASNCFLICVFFIYYLLQKINRKLADNIFFVSLILIGILHLIIIKYFLYQLVPLDIFIYQYSLKEILFTLRSSEINYTSLIFGFLLVIITTFFFYKYLIKTQLSKKLIITIYAFVILSVPLFVIVYNYNIFSLNKFSRNKSIYFYTRTASYLINTRNIIRNYDLKDSKDFNFLYSPHKNVNPEYPLLHKFEKKDILGNLINTEDTIPPNIVILIVEGLNDDFIHPYSGINLMPFLNKLKDKSLYWNNCLTMGERSFAVVPSILGGLPHGVKGFTLLKKLPSHYSLVSVLNSNDYYTSFFYGQGSWFHQKDRFFKYNNIDLNFDNSRFSDKYEKIIVGKDKFFWGYNDKDLFNQSFEVIDTLPSKRRLDIYFTGSSHSPFIISEKEYYNKLVHNHIEKIQDEKNKDFFKKYINFIETIYFVDDAIKEFFKNYERRTDYSNTIFFITGDHPMTEIPIKNSIKRYNVPLIIFSSKLIKPETFNNIVCHLDIYETILAFMASNYNIKIPPVSSSLGNKLDTSDVSNKRNIALMNDNREIVDFYSNGYFLSNEQSLYKVEGGLMLREINNGDLKKQLINKLEIFKKTNLYVCLDNKIIPDSIFCEYLGFKEIFSLTELEPVRFSSEYQNIINKIPLPNKTSFFDLSFDYHGELDNKTSIVYQISTTNDSIILWDSYGLAENQDFLQFHIKIPKQILPDSTLYFKSYFWNKNKKRIEYYNLKAMLYTE